jgi:hypothetical protein
MFPGLLYSCLAYEERRRSIIRVCIDTSSVDINAMYFIRNWKLKLDKRKFQVALYSEHVHEYYKEEQCISLNELFVN